jgi:hypothetical protein
MPLLRFPPRLRLRMTLKMETTSRTAMMRGRMSRTSIVRTELRRWLLRLRDVVLAAVVREVLVVSGVLVVDGGVGVVGVRDRAAPVLLRAAEIASLKRLIETRAVLIHGPLVWVER